MDVSTIIIAASIVLHFVLYLLHRRVVKRLRQAQIKSDEAWKAAIDEIQKQLYGE